MWLKPNPDSVAYRTVGSLGSKASCVTPPPGRFRVILAKTTPLGAPTVEARAFVLTNTLLPLFATTATLLGLAGATAVGPALLLNVRLVIWRQLPPPSVVWNSWPGFKMVHGVGCWLLWPPK